MTQGIKTQNVTTPIDFSSMFVFEQNHMWQKNTQCAIQPDVLFFFFKKTPKNQQVPTFPAFNGKQFFFVFKIEKHTPLKNERTSHYSAWTNTFLLFLFRPFWECRVRYAGILLSQTAAESWMWGLLVITQSLLTWIHTKCGGLQDCGLQIRARLWAVDSRRFHRVFTVWNLVISHLHWMPNHTILWHPFLGILLENSQPWEEMQKRWPRL